MLADINADDSGSYVLNCSYLEIYNDKIYDLLSAEQKSTEFGRNKSRSSLKLKEDAKGRAVPQNLTKYPITSPSEGFKLLEMGQKNRSVGDTSMNKQSSRSHSVFTLYLERTSGALPR